jgi:hypothetical protein
MTGTAATDDPAAAAAAVPESPAEQPADLCKPLKSLLKTSHSSGDKCKKRVQFSETLLVFCDDWPEELMPQIIALKSPSDFSLVEVAAQGYMFEPPAEYQDCLSFDPPPDYRDLGQDASEPEAAFAFIDSSEGKDCCSWSHSHLSDKICANRYEHVLAVGDHERQGEPGRRCHNRSFERRCNPSGELLQSRSSGFCARYHLSPL